MKNILFVLATTLITAGANAAELGDASRIVLSQNAQAAFIVECYSKTNGEIDTEAFESALKVTPLDASSVQSLVKISVRDDLKSELASSYYNSLPKLFLKALSKCASAN